MPWDDVLPLSEPESEETSEADDKDKAKRGASSTGGSYGGKEVAGDAEGEDDAVEADVAGNGFFEELLGFAPFLRDFLIFAAVQTDSRLTPTGYGG